MNFRIASTLLALALPLCAQEQSASQVEATFYKAYYLEKGQRDFAGAMALYEEFLNKAPDHALAKEAATLQFRLLDRTGKTKERDAFKTKYEKLLGNIASAPTRPAAGEGEGGERGDRPQRGDRQGGGQGGPGGAGGRRGGGLFALMRPDAKLADMSKEEIQGIKDGLGQSSRMVDMVRERQGDEAADKLEKAIASLKTALDADKMDDAQKAVDALREAMPQMGRGRGGRGGGEGGDAGGAGGQRRRGGGGGGGEGGGGGRNGGGGGGGGGGGN